MSDERKPVITESLIKYLDKLYPDKAPELEWSDRRVWLARGEVGVVRHLKMIYTEQQENLLGDKS